MSNINNPDIDPANNYSLVGVINFAFQKMMQAVNGMLPAKVLEYDRVTNRASVQLLVNLKTTSGASVERGSVASVPVLQMGGGTYSISFPLKAGDLGWLLANDRDISQFLENYNAESPSTNRMHNFADGVFFPDAMKSFNINAANKDYLVIQSEDGKTTIEMGVSTSVGTPHEINIKCDRLNITPNTGTGYVNINGNLFVNGLIESPTGAVTPLPIIPPFPP